MMGAPPGRVASERVDVCFTFCNLLDSFIL